MVLLLLLSSRVRDWGCFGGLMGAWAHADHPFGCHTRPRTEGGDRDGFKKQVLLQSAATCLSQ